MSSIIIDGPASANYDEDLGALMLSDWFHESVFSLWGYARIGIPPVAENGLVNGTNVSKFGHQVKFLYLPTLGI